MKKSSFFLSLILIIGTQLSAMKRDASQITPSTETPQELWLPNELITKIAVTCDPKSRTSLSLVNKEYNKHASVRKEEGEICLHGKYRLYYLFYGCMHNLKNLVQQALKLFNPEYAYTLNFENPDQTIITYPDKKLLNLAKHHIEQLTQSDATKLLPHFPEIEIGTKQHSLSFAVDYTDEALLLLLLKHPTADGNALNYQNKTALNRLLFLSSVWQPFTKDQDIYLHMAKLLLQHIDKDLDTLWAILLQAVRFPSKVLLETIKHILAQDDININTQDPTKKTILHKIKCKEELDGINILHLLLAHSNINVNTQDNRKLTPLNAAIVAIEDFQTHFEKIKLLLAHPDINVNLQDHYNNTPLHNAVINDDINVTRLLLAHPNINVNLQARDGNTPLHDAIERQNSDIITLLLSHPDINFDIQNIDHDTPISLAKAIHEKLVDDYTGWTTESSLDEELLTEINKDQLERIETSAAIVGQLKLAHTKCIL